MMSLEDRIAFVGRVLADPPSVHATGTGEIVPGGAWRSVDDCYTYLAEQVDAGTRTLETGLGISTVLFAAFGADHTCVVADQAEVERWREYMTARGLPVDVRFEVGSSDRVLPHLTGEFDLFFIDGCHGYPLPIIDWFYGAGLLRSGGIVVVDDADLPAVRRFLLDYLNADHRWQRTARHARWVAYRRDGAGDLGEEWRSQPFLGMPLRLRPWMIRATSAANRARRIIPKVQRMLKGG